MKKLFAILMIVTMVVCYMPTVAFADVVNDNDGCTRAEGYGLTYTVEKNGTPYNCDIKVYCNTLDGGTISEDKSHWDEYNHEDTWAGRGGYYTITAKASERWVLNWATGFGDTGHTGMDNTCEDLGGEKIYAYVVDENDSNTLRVNRFSNAGSWDKHYVVHAHFNPTITVNYEGGGSFIDVNNGDAVEAEYGEDKVFTAQDGYAIDTVTVTDLNGNSVSDSCFTNNGDSITFNKVTQPLNVKVTFKENGDNSKPQDNNASFFLEDNGKYFPAHLANGTLGPLVGRVEGGKVKTPPDNDQLMSTIQDYYRLSYKEMDGVHVEWDKIQDMSNHGCPYHVDGVAYDKNNQPLSKHDNRARITYMDETGTNVLYTDYVEKDKPIDHAGVPTPEKEGYKFDKWVLPDGSTMGGADPVTEDLTFKATWTEDNGSGNGENATGDDCVEQENLDYSTLINDCDFTFYCTPGGGKIEEVDWGEYHFGRKTFPMLSGYCKFEATPNEGWVFNEWKHEISRDAYEVLGKQEEEWRAENRDWTIIIKWEGLKPVTDTRYAFSPNGSEIELRRGPWKVETKGAKLHYVVHAHFNPKITVEYDDSRWSVTDGGKKVADGVQVVVPYKTDKTFGIQTVNGKTAKIEVVDVGGNPVDTGYTENQDGSITFNKVSQPLKLKVTFEDKEVIPDPEEQDASFFFHAGGNNYFPDHSFDDDGHAVMGPLVGKVENNQVKTEPNNDQLKSAIQDYYRLTDDEMVGVKWKWNVVKGHDAEGGLECLGCPYHVDGVALDKAGNSLKVKYSMEYLVDGKHHYTARLDESTKNTHEGVPIPTKLGYNFAGWKLITPNADDISVS